MLDRPLVTFRDDSLFLSPIQADARSHKPDLRTACVPCSLLFKWNRRPCARIPSESFTKLDLLVNRQSSRGKYAEFMTLFVQAKCNYALHVSLKCLQERPRVRPYWPCIEVSRKVNVLDEQVASCYKALEFAPIIAL